MTNATETIKSIPVNQLRRNDVVTIVVYNNGHGDRQTPKKTVEYARTTPTKDVVKYQENANETRYDLGSLFTISRQLTEAEAAAKHNAYLDSLESDVFQFIMDGINHPNRAVVKANEAFAKELLANGGGNRPQYTVRTHGELSCKAQGESECWNTVKRVYEHLTSAEKMPADVMCAEALHVAAIQAVLYTRDRVTEDILRDLRGSQGSTCAWTNIAEADVRAGQLDWCRSGFGEMGRILYLARERGIESPKDGE